MTPVYPSPDCRDGNHHKCDLQAWDEITDQPTKCECDCHRQGLKAIGEDGPELLEFKGGERVFRPRGDA